MTVLPTDLPDEATHASRLASALDDPRYALCRRFCRHFVLLAGIRPPENKTETIEKDEA